ncbi:beta-ketoacyl-[acyl-carrier-protein] synthase family protein [Archangium lansingense]|uniref:Beta-ketoacyl-[acyl-carrier-protein] synthase family protein n=1 Tax=Archangium lansingense TaxID=2995310 RepID=A0ABT4ALF5_9BACT|nr:beta-ketoacyl-[acyl-carrier-protein] synthase family protein [Archangium lansinium]MCY1082527.1 beta-ketoacyl-[acyl-carrier-protein] synthase family protein [Archangium lansinium]
MRRPLRRVVVTGLGTIAPHGFDTEEVFQRLYRGESAIRRITHFDTSSVPCKIGGVVEGFDAKRFVQDRDTLRNLRTMDTVHQWALCACLRALSDARLEEPLLAGEGSSAAGETPGVDRKRMGVCLGMGLSGRTLMQQVALGVFDKYRGQARQEKNEAQWMSLPAEDLARQFGEIVARELNPLYFLQQCPSVAAAYIAMRYRAMGPNMTIVSLCAASAQAIGEAAWMVARGDADVMLAGGADSMLNSLDLTAFCKLNAVTGKSEEVEGASKPFDLRRDGCVVGEGAAALVLESAEQAQRRGARIYAELIGYGSSDDGYKISAPSEDGEGAVLSMTMALHNAGLAPEDIDHINAHGTSTPLNDRIETHAIKRVLGEHARRIPVVSTKSMTGHLIAAAGAIEALISIKSLEHQKVPPTRNLLKPDPLCDLDYVHEGGREVPGLRTVLSNSFAIGGVNATLIFRRWEEA